MIPIILLGIGSLSYYLSKNKNSNVDNILSNITSNNNLNSSANSSKLNGLSPQMKSIAIKIIADAKQQGVNLVIAEGYRTQATQNKYYAQGRTTKGGIITQVKVSKHTSGKAVDFDYIDSNGNQKILTSKQWKVLGNLAAKYGAIWGGNWKTLKDYRHIELA